MIAATSQTKKCINCGQEKPLSEYYSDTQSRSICIECRRRMARERYALRKKAYDDELTKKGIDPKKARRPYHQPRKLTTEDAIDRGRVLMLIRREVISRKATVEWIIQEIDKVMPPARNDVDAMIRMDMNELTGRLRTNDEIVEMDIQWEE